MFATHSNFFWRKSVVVTLLGFLLFCSGESLSAPGDTQSATSQFMCGDDWAKRVDAVAVSGDGQGHGPDIGSQEWQSTIEFKLGLRGKPHKPELTSKDWCSYIDEHVEKIKHTRTSTGPAFSCVNVRAGSMEAVICDTPELGKLDRDLQAVFDQVISGEHPDSFRAEQRGWIKGRNECWKAPPYVECISEAYIHRIAELQARFDLVEHTGPITFNCNDKSLSISFYTTEPATLIAHYADKSMLMFSQPSASGTKYDAGDYQFWEHQGQATLTWGYNTDAIKCSN